MKWCYNWIHWKPQSVWVDSMVRSFHLIVNIPSVMLRIVLNHSCEDELVSVQYLCIPHSWGWNSVEFKIFQIIFRSYSLIWLWSLLLFLAEIWKYSKLAFGRYEVQALSDFEIYWFWVSSRLTLSTALQSLVWVLYFFSSFIHIA